MKRSHSRTQHRDRVGFGDAGQVEQIAVGPIRIFGVSGPIPDGTGGKEQHAVIETGPRALASAPKRVGGKPSQRLVHLGLLRDRDERAHEARDRPRVASTATQERQLAGGREVYWAGPSLRAAGDARRPSQSSLTRVPRMRLAPSSFPFSRCCRRPSRRSRSRTSRKCGGLSPRAERAHRSRAP